MGSINCLKMVIFSPRKAFYLVRMNIFENGWSCFGFRKLERLRHENYDQIWSPQKTGPSIHRLGATQTKTTGCNCYRTLKLTPVSCKFAKFTTFCVIFDQKLLSVQQGCNFLFSCHSQIWSGARRPKKKTSFRRLGGPNFRSGGPYFRKSGPLFSKTVLKT